MIFFSIIIIEDTFDKRDCGLSMCVELLTRNNLFALLKMVFTKIPLNHAEIKSDTALVSLLFQMISGGNFQLCCETPSFCTFITTRLHIAFFSFILFFSHCVGHVKLRQIFYTTLCFKNVKYFFYFNRFEKRYLRFIFNNKKEIMQYKGKKNYIKIDTVLRNSARNRVQK